MKKLTKMILHLRNKLTLSKPHLAIPHLILKCTREREGGLVLDATVMLPPSTESENGDLLPHASSKQQPLPW